MVGLFFPVAIRRWESFFVGLDEPHELVLIRGITAIRLVSLTVMVRYLNSASDAIDERIALP
jgi:hypothetical protein